MTADKKIELLAPAGSFECLTAAVQSGADAVYFAGKKFGARGYADNFSEDEIRKAIDYCALRNVKTHVTVNTACYDFETESVLNFVDFIYKEGADAVIVSDLGIIRLIKKYFPGLSVHASTQMTIHNLSGAETAKKLGAERAVLSRELSEKEIKYISDNSDIELEMFVHGALCMCYSGQCLLSSMIGKRSGNRGECAQPCRLPFGDDKRCVLSLKDLCLVRYLENIKKLGVSSLKIEGRMKGSAYVAAVVKTYSKYLDSAAIAEKADYETLEKIFNRGGLTDGYFTNKKGEDMFAFRKPDNPYLKQNPEIKKKFEKNYIDLNEKKTDVKLRFAAELGAAPKMELFSNGFAAEYICGNAARKAEKRPVDKEFVKAQLERTGATPFEIKDIEISLGDGLFFSKAELNEMRRCAFDVLEKKIIAKKKRKSCFRGAEKEESINKSCGGFSAYVSGMRQLEAVMKFDFRRIYISFELLKNLNELPQDKINLIALSIPYITKDFERDIILKALEKAKSLGIKKLLVHNISQLEYGGDFELTADAGFNLLNGESLEAVRELGIKSAILSRELSLKQIKKMKKPVETEVTVYGHIPVMVCENCIIKNYEGCKCGGGFRYIKDRKNMLFPVKRDYPGCRSVLYNSVPIYSADKNIEADCMKNLFFTIESEKECENICNAYMNNGSNAKPENYTGGYLFI